jgi:Zn-dependent protease with chaperone function
MADESTRRYEQISARAYEHPADRAATTALHAVPLLDKVIKRLTDLGHERRLRQIVLGNAIRLGEDQLPVVWEDYVACLRILDLPTVPGLYVFNDPLVNAMTIGAKTPIVLANSSLIASYDRSDVQSVLAHEVGHVLSEHNYYTTALILLSLFIEGTLPKNLLLGLPAKGMYLALLEWSRAAELSADRASAIVMADPLAPCRMIMRLAGGSLPGTNFEAFMRQATEYDEEDDLFSRHARFWREMNLTHPIAVRRVKELVAWVQSGEFDRIRDGQYARRGQEPPPSATFTAAVNHYRDRFAHVVERTSGSAKDLTDQLTEWLRRHDDDADE